MLRITIDALKTWFGFRANTAALASGPLSGAVWGQFRDSQGYLCIELDLDSNTAHVIPPSERHNYSADADCRSPRLCKNISLIARYVAASYKKVDVIPSV